MLHWFSFEANDRLCHCKARDSISLQTSLCGARLVNIYCKAHNGPYHYYHGFVQPFVWYIIVLHKTVIIVIQKFISGWREVYRPKKWRNRVGYTWFSETNHLQRKLSSEHGLEIWINSQLLQCNQQLQYICVILTYGASHTKVNCYMYVYTIQKPYMLFLISLFFVAVHEAVQWWIL